MKINKHARKDSASVMGGHLGGRLRSARAARKLTLQQLSQMAGVSKAMLSQIEQDKVNPTVAVMLKISSALKMNIGELVSPPTAENIFNVIHQDDKRYTFRSDSSCTIRTVSPLSLEKNIEFYQLTLERGGQLSSDPHYPGTEEFVYVAKGRLVVVSGDQSAKVSKGDSIHYRADLPHTLQNIGRSQVEAYMIVQYKTESLAARLP